MLKLLIFNLIVTGIFRQSLQSIDVTHSILCFCTKGETPLCQTVKKFNVHNGDTFEICSLYIMRKTVILSMLK